MTQVPEHYVYLDWAATAPLSEAARAAMQPYLEPGRGNFALGMNANSLHAPGRAAFEAMERARHAIAFDVGASRPAEIVFTSGATEADNMAVRGMALGATAARRKKQGSAFAPQVVVSAIEHDAVLSCARALEREGFAVTYVKPDRAGFVTPEALQACLTDATVLVSVQLANSEVGSIQPIAQLAACAHDAGALFHTDAVQALGKVPVDVGALGVDAASFSAHKIGGPKGVGALYLKARTPFAPQALGGGQEDGRRSGTQNVCGIAGFAAACHEAVANQQVEASRLRGLRDWLFGQLVQFPRVRKTVPCTPGQEDYLPNIVHVLVSGMESETLVLRLDASGYGVSGGSACSSRSLEPSHVLRAMGVPADDAYGALRISMGSLTCEDDVKGLVAAFAACVDGR